jgi:hypothetical protein
MSTPRPTDDVVALVVGVARLGERSLRGWWRTYGLDAAGKYVLEELFPRTWRPVAIELDIASATAVHDELLGRPTALHLFSDYLPFRRWAAAWLAEQKTVEPPDDLLETMVGWDVDAAITAIRGQTAAAQPSDAERVGRGLLLGRISRAELADGSTVIDLSKRLAAAYLDQSDELYPPYLDLVG